MPNNNIYANGDYSFETYRQLARDAKNNIKSIRLDIDEEVIADPILNAVNTPSRTSVWEQMSDVISYIMWILHGTWVRYEQRLMSASKIATVHGAQWVAELSRRFQYGDTLVESGGQVYYDPINPANQIITSVAVVEQNGYVVVKAAKTVSGVQVPLDSSELASFDAYLNRVLDAGVHHYIITANADLIRIFGTIYIDGLYPLSTVQSNVEAAIEGYIKALPFDGTFSIQGLIDIIQVVRGVKYVDLTLLESMASIGSTFHPIFVYEKPYSGYYEIDGLNPLSTTLNYVIQ